MGKGFESRPYKDGIVIPKIGIRASIENGCSKDVIVMTGNTGNE